MGYSSSFFIGLSFRSGLKCIDVTPAIQGFVTRVNSWEGKRRGMELLMIAHTKNTIPSFVYNTIAAPSRTSGCTPTRGTSNRSKLSTVSGDFKGSVVLGYDSRENQNLNNSNMQCSAEKTLVAGEDVVCAESDEPDDPQAQFAAYLISNFSYDINNHTHTNVARL